MNEGKMNINSGYTYVYKVNVVKPRHLGPRAGTRQAGTSSESAGSAMARVLACRALSQLCQAHNGVKGQQAAAT